MSKRKTPTTTTDTTGTTDPTGTGQTGDSGTTSTGTGTAGKGTGGTGTGHTGTSHKKPGTTAQPPLFAPMLRNMQDDQIAGIALHGDQLGVALAADADQLAQTALMLGRATTILPRNVLTADDRPVFARMMYLGQDNFVRKTAGAITLSGLVLDQKDAFLGFELLGDRVHDSAMDLRLIYGTFQYYMIDKLTTYLEARLADPLLTRTEMESLLNDFGPALVKLNDVLAKGPESKAQLAAVRTQAAGQAQDAEAEANLQNVMYQLHNNITPQRQSLLAAAQRHMKQTQGGEAAAGRSLSTAATTHPASNPGSGDGTPKMIR